MPVSEFCTLLYFYFFNFNTQMQICVYSLLVMKKINLNMLFFFILLEIFSACENLL